MDEENFIYIYIYIYIYIHTYTHMCIYIYAQWNIIQPWQKEGNPVICNDMDEPGRHYAKWNKSATEKQILQDSTHMRSLK